MPKTSRSPKRTKAPKLRKSASGPGIEPGQFLTIDLDVRSRRSLAPLLSVWPEAYQPLSDSRWLIRNAFVANSAETAAKYLLGYIAKLRGKALESWRQADRRIFDIGVQAGGPGRAFEEVQLSADTLRRIAIVRGQVKVTVYPAQSLSRSVRSHPPRRTKGQVLTRFTQRERAPKP
jgi:hypothetical protein